ncbi:MAG: class IV adenylate cyclase [Terriglobia bacterium]|jgi:adenylate cyclase class 2
MKHRHETEIKLAVQDPGEIRRRFAELGFRLVLARHFESNYLFDFPDQRLRKSRCLIRLRFVGDDCLLTFKGAPLRSHDYKIRREIETHVEDGHRLREILLLLGLCEVFSYEKFRTIYAPPGKRDVAEAPQVVLDETPIGNYLELEGPQRWIDLVARQLGYPRREYITDSYATLYRKKCQTEHKTPGNMIFPSRES